MFGEGATTLDRYLLDKLLDNKIMGSSSYLSKPRLGARSTYNATDKDNLHGKNKKARLRKSAPKMTEYGIKKRLPDYTELAYKEAVSRLRYFLSESYAPSSRSSKLGGASSLKNLDESGDEGYDILSRSKYPLLNLYGRRPLYSSTGNINSVPTPLLYPTRSSILARRYPVYSRDYTSFATPETSGDANASSSALPTSDQGNKTTEPRDSELMSFIQKQEEYIEQLERESSYCRDELNNLLGKVKEVITENESLHEKQKNHLISSVMDHHSGHSESDEDDLDRDSDVKYSSSVKSKKSTKSPRRMEGPNIVYESKISELEAQLTQATINLKKLQDENSDIRRRLSEGIVDSPCLDSFKRQIENLQRDKAAMEAQVSRLSSSLDECKDTDSELVTKARKSADMAYQANNDKIQLETEIRRLRDEIERQQSRIRELLAEQGRRVIDERNAIERRYCHQVEQLTTDLTTHWDSATKLQLELERQKREESELKRELSQKTSQIEELKLELKNKVAGLQADISQLHADKAAVEEELANARLMLERHQRQAKHDSNRLNSEIQSVRQRLDRADADLIHSRRENLRLIDQLSTMEKDMNLKSLRPASPTKEKENSIKEKELTNMIHNMESKHAQTVSELETMVCSQNTLMEKLTAECHLLTSKLDDASQRHKQEMASLQNNLEMLSARVSSQAQHNDYINKQTAPYTQNTPTPRENGRNGNQYPSEGQSSGRTSQQGNYYTQPDQRQNVVSRQSSRTSIQPDQRQNVISRQSSRTSIHNGSGRQSASGIRQDDNTQPLIPPNSPTNDSIKADSNLNLSSSLSQHKDLSQHIADSQVESEKEQSRHDEEVKDEIEYGNGNVTYAEDANAYEQNYSNDQQQYDDPNQQYVDPNQYTDPNQQYVDPNQQYSEEQYAVDPNQQYVDPNQQYDQQYTDQQYDPNQQYEYSQQEQ